MNHGSSQDSEKRMEGVGVRIVYPRLPYEQDVKHSKVPEDKKDRQPELGPSNSSWPYDHISRIEGHSGIRTKRKCMPA